MEVRINGRPFAAPAGVNTIKEFAVRMRLQPENTLLKLNHQPVPWEQWSSTPLAADDTIEIVVFVGGG